MAIFGSLHDMPLSTLLPILGRRRGVLELFNLPGHPPVSLWLEQNQLVHVMQEGRLVERGEAQRLLGELLLLNHGDYEFVVGLPPSLNAAALNWPLDRVVAIKPQEKAAPGGNPEGQQWLQDQLNQFLQAANPLLRDGASSREIANRLGLPLDQVRYYLHKLSLQGKVKPVRGFWDSFTQTQSGGRSFAARLLAALGMLRKRV